MTWLSSLSVIVALTLGFSIHTLSSMAPGWSLSSYHTYNNNNNMSSEHNNTTLMMMMTDPPSLAATTTGRGSAGISVSNLDQLRFLATAIAAVVATDPVIPHHRHYQHHRTNVPTIQINNQSVCGDDGDNCLVYLTDTIHQDDYCLLSQAGIKRTSRGIVLPNQDRMALFHPTAATRPKHQQQPQPPPQQQLLLALFDGHNTWGHETAQAAQVDLPWNILTKLRHLPQHDESGESIASYPEEERIKRILNESFVEMDRDRSIRLVPDSGSTALVILQQNSKVYLASAGDSTAFCAQWRSRRSESSHDPTVGTAPILVTAVRHKPGHPEERARIESAHGQVWIPAKASQTTRVGIPRAHPDGSVAADEEIIWLAMSRCLGDEEGKKLGYLLAEPSIQVLDLTSLESSENVFCVAASDGLTDVLSTAHVANQLGAVLYGGSNTSARDKDARKATVDTQLGETCRELVLNAAQRWGDHYRDDISIVVSKIFRNN